LLHQAHKGVTSAGYLPLGQTKRMVRDAGFEPATKYLVSLVFPLLTECKKMQQ
jgi:hypothetical protein